MNAYSPYICFTLFALSNLRCLSLSLSLSLFLFPIDDQLIQWIIFFCNQWILDAKNYAASKKIEGKNIQLYVLKKKYLFPIRDMYDTRQMNLTTIKCDGFDFSCKPRWFRFEYSLEGKEIVVVFFFYTYILRETLRMPRLTITLILSREREAEEISRIA